MSSFSDGVSTRRILDQIARQRGWDPSTYNVAQEERERMCQLASQALERAWRAARWPFLMLVRRVAFRPAWSSSDAPFPEGEQVERGGRYWEAVRDGVESVPQDGSPDWRPCEGDMVCGISYAQYGIDEIDLTRGVFTLDPDRRADALSLPAARSAFGCVVQQERGRPFCAKPYVRYRPVPPHLSCTPWSASAHYAKGDLAEGPDGDSYEAVAASAGVVPGQRDAAGALPWHVRRCPRAFESYVVQCAAAELATDDDAQKARLARADAELQGLINALCAQVGDASRARVRVLR